MDKQAQKNVFTIFFLIIILIMSISGAFTYFYVEKLLDTNQVVVNIEEVTRAANQSLLTLTEAEAEVSNFVLSRNPQMIENLPYYLISSEINVKALSQLVEQNPTQTKLVQQLQPLLATKINMMQTIVTKVKNNDIAGATQIAASIDRYKLNKGIKILINLINQNESQHLNQQSLLFANKVKEIDTLFITLLGVMILVAVAGYGFIAKYFV